MGTPRPGYVLQPRFSPGHLVGGGRRGPTGGAARSVARGAGPGAPPAPGPPRATGHPHGVLPGEQRRRGSGRRPRRRRTGPTRTARTTARGTRSAGLDVACLRAGRGACGLCNIPRIGGDDQSRTNLPPSCNASQICQFLGNFLGTFRKFQRPKIKNIKTTCQSLQNSQRWSSNSVSTRRTVY